MDDRTLTALKESIRHWERNVAAPRPSDADTSDTACALCSLFNKPGLNCGGCPVKARGGYTWCLGTPYMEAFRARKDWLHGIGTRENWQLAAQRELDFLKSLLPEGERP